MSGNPPDINHSKFSRVCAATMLFALTAAVTTSLMCLCMLMLHWTIGWTS